VVKTELRITGMTCQNCVRHVEGALRQQAGVVRAEVNLQRGTAIIDHDETVSTAELCALLSEAGYEGEELVAAAPGSSVVQ
jgi:copper chaperone CopZ